MSHLNGWLWPTQFKSQFAKIGGHCSSEGGDKTFFEESRDDTVNESRDSMVEMPLPKLQRLQYEQQNSMKTIYTY